jgi:hypothetical protein
LIIALLVDRREVVVLYPEKKSRIGKEANLFGNIGGIENNNSGSTGPDGIDWPIHLSPL